MRRILPLLLLAFLLPLPARADLSDFQKEVEKAREEAPPEEEAEDEDDDGDNPFFQFLWEIFRIVWVANNLTTTYGSYPYAADGYIRWAEFEEGGAGDDFVPTGRRNHRYRSEVQAFALEGMGWGTWLALEGHAWRFFGPYCEGWLIGDGGDLLGGLRLGLTLALFQSDPFSLGLYGQGNFWFGLMSYSGAALGIELRSYPFRPLSLQARAGVQVFDGFSLGELEARAGLLLGRWEAFAGVRRWSLMNGTGDITGWHAGPFAGAGLHY